MAVLLRIYAKCIAGQQDEAMRRISGATQAGQPDPGSDDGDQDDEPRREDGCQGDHESPE